MQEGAGWGLLLKEGVLQGTLVDCGWSLEVRLQDACVSSLLVCSSAPPAAFDLTFNLPPNVQWQMAGKRPCSRRRGAWAG
jgi:hypothetical protein